MDSHTNSHIQSGKQYFARRRFEEAHREFSLALHELAKAEESGLFDEEALSELYVLRATSLVSIDEEAALKDPDIFNQVMDDYDHAIDLDPATTNILNLRGRMFLNCQFADYKAEAKKDFDAVLKADANNPDGLRMMGLFSASEKEYDRSIYYFSLALEQEPNSSETYAARGMSYFRRTPPQLELALQDFAKAQEITPEREDLYIWRAQILQQLKLNNEALEEYNRLIDLAPKADYFVDRGTMVLETNPRQAFDDFTQAVHIGTHPLAYNNLAWMLLQDGEYEEAIGHAEMALKVDPTTTVAYATLAEIYAKMKDDDKFYESLALALEHYYQDYMDAMTEPAFEEYVHERRFREMMREVRGER